MPLYLLLLWAALLSMFTGCGPTKIVVSGGEDSEEQAGFQDSQETGSPDSEDSEETGKPTDSGETGDSGDSGDSEDSGDSGDSQDTSAPVDEDEDGATVADGDCDDTDPAINPSAPEICNEQDDNCNGQTDEGVTSLFYADMDGDSFGSADLSEEACEAGTGYVADNTDCDDREATTYPGATEVCDEVDNNCDGSVDEGPPADADLWYQDADGDTYGDAGATQLACSQPSGYVADDTDCNDTDGSINPGSPETCDELDNNCDGVADEGPPADAGTWYLDADGDSFGDSGVTQMSCAEPLGYVLDNTDCDDSNPAVSPVESELCNSLDDDCDGTVDEDDSLDAGTWYQDVDGDTYGDAGATQLACSQPSGYVADDTDCNDGQADMNPGAAEVCDEQDNNCDGATDEGPPADAATWYEDADADGYGNPGATQASCLQPTAYVSDASDCDDAEPTTSPGASEVCDEVDNNCDGSVDEGPPADADIWYQDADGDTYGDAGATQLACSQPSGYVADDTDCDDADAAWYWACTDCERELVTVVGFSQDVVWPGDSSDVLGVVYVDSGSAAVSIGVRWGDVFGDEWVVCGDVDYSESVPEAILMPQAAGAYLAFGWYGSVSYVASTDITSAVINGTAYSYVGDYSGNAVLTP